VIDALIHALKFSKKELQQIQKKENKKSGSFKKRLLIKTIEITDNHPWFKYYLSKPKKFPELRIEY